MGVSLLENKAELQLVEIAILIGQFQSDRAFWCAIKKIYILYTVWKAQQFYALNLLIMR